MQLQDATVDPQATVIPRDVLEVLAARVLARVGDDPFFLGSALVAYERCAGVGIPGLAAFLGCPVAALPRLALARRPGPHDPHVREQLDRIAARTGAKRDRLAAVLQFWHREGG